MIPRSRLKKLKVRGDEREMSRSSALSYKMSTWSKSALKSSSSVVISDKSFPTLGSGPSAPPSKKPTLSFAQKVKEKADADAAADAAAAAAKQVELNRAEARRLTECAEKRQVSLVNTFYKPRTSDEDYAREDSSPDEMDYETALEYEEHMRYNRRERLRVADYSKDLSSSDDERLDEYDDTV
jgi:hypothetical protein